MFFKSAVSLKIFKAKSLIIKMRFKEWSGALFKQLKTSFNIIFIHEFDSVFYHLCGKRQRINDQSCRPNQMLYFFLNLIFLLLTVSLIIFNIDVG